MSNYYAIKNKKVALHFEEVHDTEFSFKFSYSVCVLLSCSGKQTKLLNKPLQVASEFPSYRMARSKGRRLSPGGRVPGISMQLELTFYNPFCSLSQPTQRFLPLPKSQ